MISIFSDMVERFLEIFMDDFSVFGSSFKKCMHRLTLVMMRCKEKNLVLNWKKCHFMVNQGIGSSFEECLHRLTLVLVRCKEKNLVLN
jgi:hypothetical protein